MRVIINGRDCWFWC